MIYAKSELPIKFFDQIHTWISMSSNDKFAITKVFEKVYPGKI